MYIQWGFSSLFKGEIKKVSKYSISHWLVVSKDHCGSQGILPVAANWFLISLLCFIYILYAELLPPTKIESTNVIKKIWKELDRTSISFYGKQSFSVIVTFFTRESFSQ